MNRQVNRFAECFASHSNRKERHITLTSLNILRFKKEKTWKLSFSKLQKWIGNINSLNYRNLLKHWVFSRTFLIFYIFLSFTLNFFVTPGCYNGLFWSFAREILAAGARLWDEVIAHAYHLTAVKLRTSVCFLASRARFLVASRPKNSQKLILQPPAARISRAKLLVSWSERYFR